MPVWSKGHIDRHRGRHSSHWYALISSDPSKMDLSAAVIRLTCINVATTMRVYMARSVYRFHSDAIVLLPFSLAVKN